MNGIQLKPQAARYKRADFDEDDISSGGGMLTGNGGVSPTLDGSNTILNVGHDPSRPSLSMTSIHFRNKRSIWGRSTTMERFLMALVGILATVVLLLSIVISSNTQNQTYNQIHVSTHAGSGVCLTPECVTVASTILNAMDLQADPCNDFYQYACGGWIKQNPLPDGKSIWSTFGKLWQENQLVMKNILDDPTKALHSRAERLAKTYYLSCLDKNDTIEELGSKPIVDLLTDIGGWNISESGFDAYNWKLQESLHLVHNTYSRPGFFAWVVGLDERNSSRHLIQVDQAGITLPSRDYYINKTEDDKALAAFRQYITQVGVLLGAKEDEAKVQADAIVDLELRLAEVLISDTDRRDEKSMYNKMSLADLQKLAPFLNWVDYFSKAFSPNNISITNHTDVVVYAPSYISNLSVIVSELESTREGRVVLANYLGWQTVNSMISCLSPPFRDAQRVLRKVLVGADGLETAWRQCISDTNLVLGFALSSMFVREVFDEQAKPVAEAMVEEVKDAFKDNLPHLSWMDEETRWLAREKADAVSDMIGFPEYISDPTKLDPKYVELEVNENEYFDNNIRISRWMLKKNIQKLTRLANKTEWEMSPIQVNAYYTPSRNQIVFPAGILQSPFYDRNYPRSLNFGAMGVVMGHELTHAFDDQGREYDKTGNLQQWWNNETILSFQQRAQCFVDQYSSYKVNEDSVNGKTTLGENMADNGGLKAAFYAYQGWLRQNQELPPLPGVNLTHDQLFYIGFAQVWCSTETPEATHLQILVDAHSPSKYRVVGTLSNSVEFSRTYNCKPTSKMNPPNKCEVW